uniref:DNA sulfur modification protein DndD n=1 Tax=Candidatus Kentrum sp. FM TaxID=2126340 RepID=A0A450SX28_9GAMM|nr:MAG: DNA sulfur modification protein DndD [Candidatus Kentron sp. FM]VFJ58595.1 MAG: DNA sulfur modification protein DndD [Candidatus Kentron sp. FM]VFK11144.1 MAG: DNA sulfur modification protein DndD [Candidatus Kentron sp. FM]
MHLRSIELNNWRSYRHARFEFPRPHGEKNVILILAPNEYGKTSFFEAIMLGLFGRDGIHLVPRARAVMTGNTNERPKIGYSQFLSGALHHRATEIGPAGCSVTIEVEDDEGEPIELTRRWYFRQDRSHKVADDDLTIFAGTDRVPVTPPAGLADRDGWFRDWIAQHFIHHTLAEFFLFDGEQVQRYANREMSRQVREGIEGLLGLPVLRSLVESLDKYAQNRRSSAAAPSDATVKGVEAKIATSEERISTEQQKLMEAENLLPDIEQEVGELTRALGGRGEGTKAMVGQLMQEEHDFHAEAGRAMDALQQLIAEDLALGIAGKPLRVETTDRLRSEALRERWEAGREEGGKNLDRFIRDLGQRVLAITPPLLDEIQEEVLNAAKAAWESLWHPPPGGCADDYLHAGLKGVLREQVSQRLEKIDQRSDAEIAGLVERYQTAVAQADAKKRERLELERTAPETDRLVAKLKELSKEMGELQGQKTAAERALEAAEAELADHRAELGRYLARIGASGPTLRRAGHADDYNVLIEEILEEALPIEIGDVAREMTRAWKAMAHQSERVERIEITPSCEVRMLTQDGEDLHPIEKSAGASQVFTQALITAITRVSGRAFPFVVDTPLARLSKEQRLGVLKTFTDRPGQVVLLSTDEEVVDDKLDAIRHRLLSAFELRLSFDGGVAVTTDSEPVGIG